MPHRPGPSASFNPRAASRAGSIVSLRGKLRVASALFLLLILASGVSAQVDEERPPSVVKGSSVLGSALHYPTRSARQRSFDFLSKWSRTHGTRVDPSHVRELYSNVHYEVVREACEHGISSGGRTLRIPEAQSLAIAKTRDAMINKVYGDMALDFGIQFQRLDFGNKQSGARSDVDHTAFTDFDQPNFKGKDIRAEFEKRFKKRWSIGQEACDIVIHSGRNRIPDWRSAEHSLLFQAEMVRVLRGLEATTDAYAYEGAWRMQIEWRSVQAVKAITNRLRDLKAESLKPGISPAEKLRIEREAQKVLEDCPLTSFTPEKGKSVKIAKELEMLTSLFEGIKPDILQAYSFDAAVGNYLFHLHYGDKTQVPKYLLRSFEDGIANARKVPAGQKLKAITYSKLSKQQKTKIIAELYTEFDQSKRTEVRIIMDIAVKLRHNHKVADAWKFSDKEVWGELVDFLHRQRGRNAKLWRARHAADQAQALAWAKHAYNHASTEIMAWNNILSAKTRSTAWLEPKSSPLYKQLATIEPNMKLSEFQLASFFALKKAFAQLPADQVDAIIKRGGKHARDMKILRGVVQTERALYGQISLHPTKQRKTLGKHFDDAVEVVKSKFGNEYADFRYALESGYYSDEAVSARMMQRVADQLGYEYQLTYDKLCTDAPRWVRKWSATKFMAQLLHAGNVCSALHVLQIYQQTADPDEVLKALLLEGYCRLPGVVHVFALWDGLAYGRWHGTGMLVTATALDLMKKWALDLKVPWAMPVGGALVIYVDLARTSVQIIGHEIFEPLRGDDVDMLYTGFIGPTKYDFSKPPTPFTAEDARRLDAERTKLARNREAISNPDIPLAKQKNLIEETRRCLHVVKDLEYRQEIWERYDTRRRKPQRWESGLISPGLKERHTVTSFSPAINMVPYDKGFFFGPQGAVDLGAERLTARELDRLDSLRQLRQALQKGEGGGTYFSIAEELADVLDELDDLETRHRAWERAGRYIRKINEDPEWNFEARRQNIFAFIDPLVQNRLQAQPHGFPPEHQLSSGDESLKYFTAKEKMVATVVTELVHRWANEKGPVTMNAARLNQGLEILIPRMIADYKSSEQLRDCYDDWRDSRDNPELRRLLKQQRRRYLLGEAMEATLEAASEAARERSDEYGMLVLSNIPPPEPTIRLSGVVTGEGKKEQVSFRVKVIASAIDYPPPYSVKLVSKRDQKTAKGREHRRFVAEVRDSNGRLVGTADLPLTTDEEPAEAEVVDVGPVADFFPPKLVPYGHTASLGKRPLRGAQVPIKVSLTGVPTGSHRLEVDAGGRRHTFWGRARKLGDGAHFDGGVWVPVGRTTISIRAEGVEPLIYTVERSPDTIRGKQPDFAKLQARVAKAQQELAKAKPSRRNSRLLSLVSARQQLASAYQRRERFPEAEAEFRRALSTADKHPDPARVFMRKMQCLGSMTWLGIHTANRSLVEFSWRGRVELRKQQIERRRKAGKDLKSELKSLADDYERFTEQLIQVGGSAGTLRGLWAGRIEALDRAGIPHAGLEFHPDWGGQE